MTAVTNITLYNAMVNTVAIGCKHLNISLWMYEILTNLQSYSEGMEAWFNPVLVLKVEDTAPDAPRKTPNKWRKQNHITTQTVTTATIFFWEQTSWQKDSNIKPQSWRTKQTRGKPFSPYTLTFMPNLLSDHCNDKMNKSCYERMRSTVNKFWPKHTFSLFVKG